VKELLFRQKALSTMSHNRNRSSSSNGSGAEKVDRLTFLQQRNSMALECEAELRSLSVEHGRANRLRSTLCETLADLVLLDAAFGVEKQVPERLWSRCFYTRIAPMRKQIASDRKRQKVERAEQVQHDLRMFLSESVNFYVYLVDKLEMKLTGVHESDSVMETLSSDSTSVTITSMTNPSTHGVVACLYILNIHLGDLYRYADSLSEAEKAYQKAISLGPGQGHAYNQWAVVCQMQQQDVLALYGYARSLAATHVFETSRNNLKLLLQENQKNISTKNALENVTTSSVQIKLSKSAQTKQFLEHFIDMHYQLLYWNDEKSQDFKEKTMKTTMDIFASLLHQSALGDSLLCKLVMIQAFTESSSKLSQARMTTLLMGHCIVQRINTSLQGKQSLPSTIRLLMPLLLLLEYIAQPTNIKADDAAGSQSDQILSDFGKGLVCLWNRLCEFGVDTKSIGNAGEIMLFGFLSGIAKGYIDDEEASTLVQQNPKAGLKISQDSATANSSVNNNSALKQGANSSEHGRTKIARLFYMADTIMHDDASELGRSIYKENGVYSWTDDKSVNENDDTTMIEEVEIAPKENDYLVFKKNPQGGPELLVPGALLQKRVNDIVVSPPFKTDPVLSNLSTLTTNGKANENIMPRDIPNYSQQVHMSNGFESHPPLQPSLHPPPPPPGLAPPPGFGAPITSIASPPRIPTVAESLLPFGGWSALQTSNPFANEATIWQPSYPSSSRFGAAPPSDVLFGGDAAFESSLFLGSGLLNSLLMDDKAPPTNNPFAT
jgi:tetratricopeptide (TPR) repeat protein